jgi:hypothetical protein
MSALANEAILCGQGFDEYRGESTTDEALMSPPPSPADSWMTCVAHVRDWCSSPPDWDEGIEVPSRTTLRLAEEIALVLRRRGMPAPSRVLPDGEGGVVFERREGDLYEALNVFSDGSVGLKRFRSGRMISSECVSAVSIL